MNAKTAFKTALLGSVDALTSRHTALLPHEAADERSILTLDAPYRVEGTTLQIALQERRKGQLTATLVGYDGYYPRVVLWTSNPLAYRGPSIVTFDLESGTLRLGDAEWGRAVPPAHRRFCWRFSLATPDGVAERLTGHYRAETGRAIEKEYYYGEDYVDYGAQSAHEHQTIARLFKEFGAEGPVLEFGCATGGTLQALKRDGHLAYGVDISSWAVEQATAALGPGCAFTCDAEREALPADIARRAPFGAVVMWAVLEHFHDPFRMLANLQPLTREGTLLFINTTNADSLSRHVFGAEWEGHFDWSHHSVGQISVRSLGESLGRLGWEPLRLTTDTLWTANTDPFAATMRDWYAADARFRRLLMDRNLGDFITCVARRKGSV